LARRSSAYWSKGCLGDGRSHQDAGAKHLGLKVETANSVGQMMILIPHGELLMGSTDEQVEAALKGADEIKADATVKGRIEKAERPQHKVVVSKPLLMSATEVTIGQFTVCAPSFTASCQARLSARSRAPYTKPQMPQLLNAYHILEKHHDEP